MKLPLHCCQFLGIAERLLLSGQIGKLCDSNQPIAVVEPEAPVRSCGCGGGSTSFLDFEIRRLTARVLVETANPSRTLKALFKFVKHSRCYF
jgi:hypothetical protein